MRYVLFYTLLLLLIGLSPPAQATCQGEACVSMGSNLASVDSSQSTLLSAVLTNLTGSNIDINTNELNALAQGDVDLGALITNLGSLIGSEDTATVLSSEITLSQLYSAAADAAGAAGDTAAEIALNDLSTEVVDLTETIQLGDLITLQQAGNGYNGININALELASGGVELFNGSNAVTTSEPVVVSGGQLGLGDLINSVSLSAQVVESAKIVCGPQGSTFHSSSIRVQLLLDLIDTSLDTSSLLALPGIAGVDATLSQVKLYVEVSRADGVIEVIDALNQSVTVRATPGITDLYLGQFPDEVFQNTSTPLDPSLLEFADIGSVSVTELLGGTTTVSLQAKSAAQGEAPFSETLVFTGPYPETQTSGSSTDAVSRLVDSLVSNTEYRLDPDILGALGSSILPVVQTASTGALAPTLSTVLTGVVDPLLESLGIGIGEVDVTVYGAQQTCSLSGLVYHDLNHDENFDNGDTVCDEVLSVKLVSQESPDGPALAVASVNTNTGVYTFDNVPEGNYSLVLDTNNDLADVEPTSPSGWLYTESGNGIQPLVVEVGSIDGPDFGLFQGSVLSGFVFEDNGAGAAVAHDGLLVADEMGLDGVELSLTNVSTGDTVGSQITQGGGSYTFWIGGPSDDSTWVIKENNPDTYRSISANVGNTAGTYSLETDQISFVLVAGTRYEGINFGDVKTSAMQSDNQKSGIAGSTVFYPHVFTAGSEGALAFELNSESRSSDSWQSVLYRDDNCDGQLETGEAIVSDELNVQTNEQVCLILKTFVPVQAPVDSNQVESLKATFTYANTDVQTTHTVTNITTVGDADSATLSLVKAVAQSSALPGETLVYTIRYQNTGAGEVSELKIHDNTPAYTVFASAQCIETLAELTCEVSEQPVVGDSGSITWTISGVVQPGDNGVVQFNVVVQ